MRWVRYSAVVTACMLLLCHAQQCTGDQRAQPIIMRRGTADVVRAHIMAAWKVICVGRSIAPDYMAYLNQPLFEAMLMLHNAMWRAVFIVSPYDHAIINQLLMSLHSSCEEFCDLQDEQQVYHIRHMALNVTEIWKERICI